MYMDLHRRAGRYKNLEKEVVEMANFNEKPGVIVEFSRGIPKELKDTQITSSLGNFLMLLIGGFSAGGGHIRLWKKYIEGPFIEPDSRVGYMDVREIRSSDGQVLWRNENLCPRCRNVDAESLVGDQVAFCCQHCNYIWIDNRVGVIDEDLTYIED